ncbi:MAG: hypothetical protein NC200_06205 [Candidatus Gastranaerophilales bacterium]|nr:hypothetical protein [Candidatus Gastranaerophilales bacterium]
MNISPVSNMSNFRNQTSFGMAFKKPSKEVSEFFYSVMSPMNPTERATFVKQVGENIGRAKSCPVPIEHTLCPDYCTHYGAKVGDVIYTYNPQKSTNRVNSILESMDKAIAAAENQHDLNVNKANLDNILNA